MPKAKASKSQNQLKTNDKASAAERSIDGKSQYEEQQDDEIEVLRSIFPEDFEQIETKGAWSKKAERSFKLKLVAESDQSLHITLSVTFTATYPKTMPLLSLKFGDDVPLGTQEKIQHDIETKPKDLLGEVMILDLSNDIRDNLEDAAQMLMHDRSVPSLEEERAKQEAEADRVAQLNAERDAKQLAKAREKEERDMQQMVDDELRRRDAARQKLQLNHIDSASQEQFNTNDIVLDRRIEQVLEDGKTITFQAVTPLKSLATQSVIEVLEVRPSLTMHEGESSNLPVLLLKRVSVKQPQYKKLVLDLEDELERLKVVKHENIVNVFEFKLKHTTGIWRFDILTELPSGPSLHEILKITTTISVRNARAYSIDILQGLDYLHKNGIVHGALDETNIFLCESGGGKVAKLANASFQCKSQGIVQETLSKITPGTDFKAKTSWSCPEVLEGVPEKDKTHKSDIWDFAVVLVRMIFGIGATEKSPPHDMINQENLTEAFRHILSDSLRDEPRKRPNAFELIPYEFLRTNVDPVEQHSGLDSLTGLHRRQSMHQKSSADESQTLTNPSRYVNEWFELGRLGRGGYGEVVKARNKLDGRVYAIKKITGKTQVQLSEVLSEVYLLATLNHPYVVRYFTAWPEDERDERSLDRDTSSSYFDSASNNVTDSSGEARAEVGFSENTGGLDFISSTGYPKIEFDSSDDSDCLSLAGDDVFERNDEISNDGNGAALSPGESRQRRRPATKSTLYIQMEFCEKLTLRDIIRRGVQENIDEAWRIFRQIVEGLTHIHGHAIIHRDLKPENVFIDLSNNPKIGDFGLATTGQASAKHPESTAQSGNMTKSVGTALYVAPELKSNATGAYTEKVDMYSLGIIFFEMCFPLPTAMERIHVINQLRLKEHSLPHDLQTIQKQSQGEIITWLIKHKPSERPSSAELLHGGKIPVRVEDEQIRQALSTVADSSSPYFARMMETLFTQDASNQLQDRLWAATRDPTLSLEALDYVLLQGLVKERMVSVFRRYGAVEVARQVVFPKSSFYTSADVAQFVDSSGTLVQLPYDLILPYAQMVARQSHMSPRSFTFGTVFRAMPAGGAPRGNREADFDIVSDNDKDLALTEAEVIKCLDDLIREFPCFSKTPICFHLSHSTLLSCILDFCRFPKSQQSATKEVLGKLHIGPWTWQKIRSELRSPSTGVTSSSIDDLTQFDFRDVPDKAFTKLQKLLNGTEHLKILHTVFTHISGLSEYLKRLGIHKRVFFSPLSSFNEKFYRSHMMFQCLFDTRKKDILAAGGRYDSLIHDQRSPQTTNTSTVALHAVGANIAWDRIVTSMARYQKQVGAAFLKAPEASEEIDMWKPRRFDVLVASFDRNVLRSVGVKLVAELRAQGISAELAVDARSTDGLLSHYAHERHGWIVIVKHAGFSSGKSDLRVKHMDNRGETTDIQSSEVVGYLRGEIRERDHRQGGASRLKLNRQVSHPESTPSERKTDVHVLIANQKHKKTNKTRIIEDAHERVKDLLAQYSEGPIAAVETKGDFLQNLRNTRFADPESWRKVIREVPLADRQYCQDLMDLIGNLKAQYGDTCRKCFIFNFRTGFCIDYDIGG